MTSRLPARVYVAYALLMLMCALGVGLIGLLLGGLGWAVVAANAAAVAAAVGGGLWIRRRVISARAEEDRCMQEARDRGEALGTADAVQRALLLYEAAVFPLIPGSVNTDEQQARREIAYQLAAFDSLPWQVRLLAAEALEVIDGGDVYAARTAMQALSAAVNNCRYAM
ncbi:hypothetical protein ABT272_44425 [Streptomyces sp900105245]|uniref:Uncharacterized protein n=1 Tax=Streptomyces sp. 900105245 TaxID=3154379 RepID=A0ABV1ULF9_9ACTN